jgi:spore coat protein H
VSDGALRSSARGSRAQLVRSIWLSYTNQMLSIRDVACALSAWCLLAGCARHRGLDDKTNNSRNISGASITQDAGPSVGDAGEPLPMPGGATGTVSGEAAADDDASSVFDPARVQTYEISVDPDALAGLDADPSTEQYISAMVTIDGTTYGPLGFRYEGSSGAFLVPCTASTTPGLAGPKAGKCSIKLAFDQLDDSGRYHGLKKLNLHSMGRDPSLMRERLGYGLYREMGVASPRTAYARVLINGQLEGAFLALEEVDGRFTRSRFSDGGEGNLYKEIWPLYADARAYRYALESNKGDDTNVDKMLAFAQTLARDPSAATAWLDRDYMLRYIAVDRVIMNDDGVFHWYCGIPEGNNFGAFNNHNYYWYEASAAGRFWLIPWDLDGTFGINPRVFIDVEWSAPDSCMCHIAVGFPQRAPSCDPLTAQFASWRADYDTLVDQFLAGPFAEAAVADKLRTWSAQLGPLVDEAGGAKGAPDRMAWEQAMQDFKAVLVSVREHRGYPY